MGRPELFSYLSAFVTIVLALALTNIVSSASLLLQARARVRWDGRPLLFAAIVMLAVVSEFFSLWGRFAAEQITMERLLWLLALPTVLALLAYAALPNEVGAEGLDLAAFYHDERRVWAVLFALAVVLDTARSMEELVRHGQSVVPLLRFIAPAEIGTSIALFIVYVARGRLGSWIGLILLLASFEWGVLGSSIVVRPVTGS